LGASLLLASKGAAGQCQEQGSLPLFFLPLRGTTLIPVNAPPAGIGDY
jgi:hypothetical protein